MKQLLALILMAGTAVPLKAQPHTRRTDSALQAMLNHDSLTIEDSLRTHGFFMMLTGGGLLCFSSSGGPTGGAVSLSTVIGKHFVDLSISYSSDGSIVVGPRPWLDIFGDGSAPTVPEEARSVLAAQYGQRISPTVAWSTGLAYVERSRNTRTLEDSGGWYANTEYWWEYSSTREAYVAVPVTITLFSRWTSWLGAELKAQILVSYAEITGNVGISIGFGAFPKEARM